MSVDDDIKSLVRESAANATDLLAYASNLTNDPVLVMTSLMLSSAVFARSMGMDRSHFLEGATAAFNSVEEGTPHATH